MRKLWVLAPVMLGACVSLNPATQTQAAPTINAYKFVVIPDTGVVTSALTASQPGGLKEVEPGTFIAEALAKKGITEVPRVEPAQAAQTLLVKYDRLGSRSMAMGWRGYAQEISIDLVDAKTSRSVYTCKAEGWGQTAIDDIKVAVGRCLEGLR
ncbi:hypothetical protein [Niveibacterium sp. SC-1]|uniref:hypothetical protein n=1 Tax=Niveibacterium sp. SC-1 TaxID=3135646 RepID=UPI00311FEC97